MVPMIARAVQIMLFIIGLLFIAVGILTFHSPPASPGFFASFEAQIKPALSLFIGLLCFFAVHRLARAKSKKTSPPPPPTYTTKG